MRLYIDIETRSPVDLKNHGTPRYAESEFAGINCICYAIDDQPVGLLDYDTMNTDGKGYVQAVKFISAWNAADHIVAHNASFEMEVLKRVHKREREPKFWIDTMAKAAYHGYPLSLDDAAKALGCSKLKMIQNKGAMLKLATGLYTPEDEPELFKQLYEYCAVDVEVMREIDQKLPDLPPDVQENWALDAEINMRGVPIDLTMIRNAVELRNQCALEANAEMRSLTSSCVEAVTEVAKLQKWLAGRNVHMVDCTADTVEKTLNTAILLPVERRALELRQESGLSSLAKYEKMLDYQVDGRLHQMFFWYGTHPGRPTGKGPQVVNLPRSEDPEYWADVIADSPWFINQVGQPLEKLKNGQRGAICAPPGKHLVWIDMAQFQARATFWGALEPGLRVFEEGDPYCTHGGKMFNRVITKKDDPEERQAAKASLLSFSFLGGIGAGQTVAQNYGIDFKALADMILPRANDLELMEGKRNYSYYRDKMPAKPLNEREGIAVDVLKQWFRRDYPRIEQFGDELEYAFLNGGVAGRVRIDVDGNTRIMTLPSGRQIFYRNVRINGRGYTFEMRGRIHSLWKGALIENFALGTEVDVIHYYRLRANTFIAPVVHHCYDEFTMEVDENKVDEVIEKLTALTQTKPDWCDGLPLGFDIQHGRRYGK